MQRTAGPAAPWQALHRRFGNRDMQRLLREREADRIAAQALAKPAGGPQAGGSAPPGLHQSGQAMEPAVRGDMEERFGRDFGDVRIHTDKPAGEAARAVHALAYTVGQDVVFAPDRYQPRAEAGRKLLAHELAHVTQQAPPWMLMRQEDPEAEAAEEEGPGFWGTIGGGLMGEFNEDPNFAMIGVDVGVSLIPILDQASDIRDIIAHLYYLIVHSQYNRFMRWLGLVFTLIGLIPEVGSAIKGASKFVIRGVRVVVSHLADLLRPLSRIFPDLADLGRLRAYVARNWDRFVTEGMAAWRRTADRVSGVVRMIPDFIGGRLRLLREGWERITRLAPTKLAEAFDWIRRQWESVLEAVQRRLAPARAAPPPPPPPPRARQVYAEGELRPITGTPEVVRGPRSGVRPEYSASPTPPRRPPPAETPRGSTGEDIGEVLRAETGHTGRSVSDTAGHTADESAELGGEIVGELGGRLDRFERHHSMFVFVLRAIESRRAGRAAREVTGAGGEGFRQIVDDLFPQGLVGMERMVHVDLHRALNDILDEMLEPQRVLDLIARRGAPEGFGAGLRVVERGGAREMMQRLQHVTELELVEIVEQAYRRVFAEHPGLVSDEVIEETLQAIERVRRAL